MLAVADAVVEVGAVVLLPLHRLCSGGVVVWGWCWCGDGGGVGMVVV